MGEINSEKCPWCIQSKILEKYHDEEWGTPTHDDSKHFEFLVMEVMQCGLSWDLMLKKRNVFRICFNNFNVNEIACFNENDITKILSYPDMIKSEKKIKAIINNAGRYLDIVSEFGSFDNYLWQFSNNKIFRFKDKKHRTTSTLSEVVSKDLHKRGFKYLGPVVIHSHLQAIGMINDHYECCWKYELCMPFDLIDD